MAFLERFLLCVLQKVLPFYSAVICFSYEFLISFDFVKLCGTHDLTYDLSCVIWPQQLSTPTPSTTATH